ncbi:MAG: dethiobiotin synthase [Candidatus Omnitrophica bacterium CG1_02_40_15]|nr:MAG: dethiobiotin synthase [Candidatus Omnitrophica bacterium CG1_02_40_15]
MNPALSSTMRTNIKKSGVNGLFVTGTDTGVGKTVITGCLARYLLNKGYAAITQKWVQSGCKGNFPPDIAAHLKAMARNKSYVKDYLHFVCPYKLRFPASPHLASRMENKRINPRRIIKSFKTLAQRFDFVIVEGTGGVMVPLDRRILLIDLAQEAGLPVLVVAQNKLGAINHTLLAIEALRLRKMDILGIVFNNPQKEDARIIKDNPRIIGALTRENILGVLPWIEEPEKLYESFAPIAKKICKIQR